MMLEDGTVIPSYLGIRQRGVAEDTGNFTNTALRIGEVKAIVWPDSDQSVTKSYVEYTVEVSHRDGGGPAVSTLYTNCLLANTFGSGGDKFKFTLRADPSQNAKDTGLGIGAKVLLLCANGESTRTYILSGIRDPESDNTKDQQDEGHHLLWEFNGTRATINKDGELSVMFRGATKNDGTLASGVSQGNGESSISFKKDGTLELVDAGSSQKLTFDHPGRKITVIAASNLETHAPAGTIIDSSTGNVKITSLGTLVGGDAATQSFMMGTTYRAAETILHTTMITALTTMATLLATLAALHATAGAGIAGAAAAHVVPVAGPIIGAPLLLTASVSFIAMGPVIGGLASAVGILIGAVTAFEAGTVTYLSLKNKND